MKVKMFLLSSLCFCLMSKALAQSNEPIQKKHFIGSSLFMLVNLTDDSPEFFQLTYGYRLSPKDVIMAEAITWTYKGPLGRQYGPHYENPASNFPGKVRAVGAGVSYKRFLWKDMFAQAHATALHQNYLDESGEKIQSGFQLFVVGRLGYQFKFFNNRVFLEPSVAVTWWPINTNLPESFQVQEDRFSKYFLGEPGLNFGVNF